MSSMSKCFILTNTTNNDPFFVEWKKNGLEAEIIFKPISKPLRALRRLWVKLRLPLEHIWYRDIKNQICNSDVIIVHMSPLTLNICKYINRWNPKAKVIAWYWNKVDGPSAPALQQGKYEAWSFDQNDCDRYNLRFNHQYYFKSLVIPPRETEWDVYFCGSDSGRGKEIVRIYKELCQMDLKVKFQVVYPQDSQIPSSIVSEYVDYKEVRENIAKSNAILEIVREGQVGPTLRVMEAVYFQKKLITNNIAAKQEEFYNENRIFIYPEHSREDLESFLAKDFVPYEDEIIEKYDVKRWVSNFTEG